MSENWEKIYEIDPYLIPHKGFFQHRNFIYECRKNQIINCSQNLESFCKSYELYGVLGKEDGILVKEWLPNASEVYIFGEFNGWNRTSTPLQKIDDFDNWSVFLKNKEDGSRFINHGSHLKLFIKTKDNQYLERIPAWIRYAVQDNNTKVFNGVFWDFKKYEWKNPIPEVNEPESLKIYESHVGMAGEEYRVHSYKDFVKVLYRIKDLGYNAVQLMALMEHAYYGSFGYHVTNFFAISSRFGTPEDLKELIDTAHGLGILVLMDLVHSHASKNSNDGINLLDGTDYQYFHSGEKGNHSLWDSRIFDYSKTEVLRFLLSNLAWYLTEYKFDGFRFDGVTSILYTHHGQGTGFTGNYEEYFAEGAIDYVILLIQDAVVYLMLANEVIHTINPKAISIAEDVSGLVLILIQPTLCMPKMFGGIGFDYRLAMAIPDVVNPLKQVD